MTRPASVKVTCSACHKVLLAKPSANGGYFVSWHRDATNTAVCAGWGSLNHQPVSVRASPSPPKVGDIRLGLDSRWWVCVRDGDPGTWQVVDNAWWDRPTIAAKRGYFWPHPAIVGAVAFVGWCGHLLFTLIT